MHTDNNRPGGQQDRQNDIESNKNETLQDPGAAVADYGRSGTMPGESDSNTQEGGSSGSNSARAGDQGQDTIGNP